MFGLSKDEKDTAAVAADTAAKLAAKYTEYNRVLQFLFDKHPGQGCEEEKIEQDPKLNDIHYYHIRQMLAYFKELRYVIFSRHGCSWQISMRGRAFMEEGGFKINQ